jgi:hypothetical protein
MALGGEEEILDNDDEVIEDEDVEGDDDDEDLDEDEEDLEEELEASPLRIDPDTDDITHAIDCGLDHTCTCRYDREG